MRVDVKSGVGEAMPSEDNIIYAIIGSIKR
jgi:hypothetical protein